MQRLHYTIPELLSMGISRWKIDDRRRRGLLRWRTEEGGREVLLHPADVKKLWGFGSDREERRLHIDPRIQGEYDELFR